MTHEYRGGAIGGRAIGGGAYYHTRSVVFIHIHLFLCGCGGGGIGIVVLCNRYLYFVTNYVFDTRTLFHVLNDINDRPAYISYYL